MRFLAALAVVLGVSIGVGWPNGTSGHQTGYQIIVQMTPPTKSSGSSPTLTCGWHTACVSPWSSGVGLDWDDDDDGYGNSWYFRGVMVTTNSAGGAVFKGTPLVNQTGSEVCERMTVWVTEFHHGTLRAAPMYTHVNITSASAFTVPGSVLGTYYSKKVGETIDDHGDSCDFFGSHVHEWDITVNSPPTTTSRNTTKYPSASTCHTTCGTHRNDLASSWTRKFTWNEGAN